MVIGGKETADRNDGSANACQTDEHVQIREPFTTLDGINLHQTNSSLPAFETRFPFSSVIPSKDQHVLLRPRNHGCQGRLKQERTARVRKFGPCPQHRRSKTKCSMDCPNHEISRMENAKYDSTHIPTQNPVDLFEPGSSDHLPIQSCLVKEVLPMASNGDDANLVSAYSEISNDERHKFDSLRGAEVPEKIWDHEHLMYNDLPIPCIDTNKGSNATDIEEKQEKVAQQSDTDFSRRPDTPIFQGEEDRNPINTNDNSNDSGYHTGYLSDTASVMPLDPITSSLQFPSNTLQDVITSCAKTLLRISAVRELAAAAVATTRKDTFEFKVEALIKQFFLDLQPLALNDQVKTEACKFIGSSVRRIAQSVRENALRPTFVKELYRFKSIGQEISAEEKISDSQVDLRTLLDDTIDASDDEQELPIEFARHFDFLTSVPPFKRLIERLRVLYDLKNNKMTSIRDTVGQALNRILLGATRVRVIFKVHWGLSTFMRSQYNQSTIPKLGHVITISGSAVYCQATTAQAYLHHNWPKLGKEVLSLLQSALKSINLSAQMSHNGTFISVDLKVPCVVEADGPKEDLIVIAQILAWIGAAIRESETTEVQYSEPVVHQINSNTFSLKFVSFPLAEAERLCWLPLFHNPVIAKGFPIPERGQHEIGLEITLEMMAALIGAEYAVEYRGGLLVKGLRNILVPIKRQGNLVQWHLLTNSDGRRVQYSQVAARCPERLSLNELDHDSLPKTRGFLAWWGVSESFLGTNRVRYCDINISKPSRPPRTLTMTSISAGVSHILGLNVTGVIGRKDNPRRASTEDRFEEILSAAEEMNVCIYDAAAKRAWLVSGVEVLLHLLQIKHYKKPYCIRGTRVSLGFSEPASDGPASSKAALMQMASIRLIGDSAIHEEDYYVKDLILKFWNGLQPLEGLDGEPGIAMDTKFGARLKGHEILDLTLDRGKLRKRETVLSEHNGGWHNLVKKSEAVILFGRHFGELIRPALDTISLCSSWNSLPEKRDYMAITIRRLRHICGDFDGKGQFKNQDFRIHQSSLPYDGCLNHKLMDYRCGLLHQIVSNSWRHLGSVNPPGILTDTGCIIIGEARTILESQSITETPISHLSNPRTHRVAIEHFRAKTVEGGFITDGFDAMTDEFTKPSDHIGLHQQSTNKLQHSLQTLERAGFQMNSGFKALHPLTSIYADPEDKLEASWYQSSSADEDDISLDQRSADYEKDPSAIFEDMEMESSNLTASGNSLPTTASTGDVQDLSSDNMRSPSLSAGPLPKAGLLPGAQTSCRPKILDLSPTRYFASMDAQGPALSEINSPSANSLGKRKADESCMESSRSNFNPCRKLRRKPQFCRNKGDFSYQDQPEA